MSVKTQRVKTLYKKEENCIIDATQRKKKVELQTLRHVKFNIILFDQLHTNKILLNLQIISCKYNTASLTGKYRNLCAQQIASHYTPKQIIKPLLLSKILLSNAANIRLYFMEEAYLYHRP
jgi:hypothetical protein